MFTEIWEMEDLRKRVLFTLGMLGVLRLGIFIPAPGIDREVLGKWFADKGHTFLGLYDMFSGGALQQFSVFTLGIMPYISASIVMQLLAEMVPSLKRIKDEGQQGRNRITQFTRYLTIVVAVAQSFTMAVGLEDMRFGTSSVVIEPGIGFRLLTVLTMTSGSCFIMWLGEQITERGIGNGSSVLICAGIIDRVPAGANQLFELVRMNDINLLQATLLLCFMFLVVYAIVYVERGQRRIPLQYAKRVLGRKVYDGQTTYLPLKVNLAGTVPPIFASSVLMLPASLTSYANNVLVQWLAGAFGHGRWLYNLSYVVLIAFFAFFYTALTFNPEDVAENIKKQGGYIPRVRPGKETAAYIDHLVTRLTAGGAVYLSVLSILPTILVSNFNIPFYFGGTSLLIIVGVTLDTVAQIEAQLSTRHYDGVVAAKGARGRRQPVGSRQSGS
jgi:preprotein translocase subunit SecY